jgi:DNA-binding PadR family transcriptional regulator
LSVDEFISDFSRFYILTLLYEGPCHGYNILDKFRKRLGKDVSPSLVYPFLQHLEQKGLVKHTVEKVGDKEKKVFKLTNEGKQLCRRLFKRFSALVYTAIEPSLEICAHCGCKVYEGGYRETIDRRETTFCCIHCAQSYKMERGMEEKLPLPKKKEAKRR